MVGVWGDVTENGMDEFVREFRNYKSEMRRD